MRTFAQVSHVCRDLEYFLGLTPVTRLKLVNQLFGHHMLNFDSRCFPKWVRIVHCVVLTETLTVRLGSTYSSLAECKF